MAKVQKRQRQKEQRRQKIEAEVRAYRARRRKRLILNISILVVVLGVIGASVYSSNRPKPKPAPKIACGGKQPAKKTPPILAQPPMTIDTSKTYTASMVTSCGTIEIELADDTSPNTVNSFVFLAKKGFYNGLVFHRIVNGFALQGGDPRGDGSGGPGYEVVDVPPVELKYSKGVVAMAKTGQAPAGSAGSQFFIVPGDGGAVLNGTPDRPAQYALLGTVKSGFSVISKIEKVPTVSKSPGGEKSTPTQTVYILRITIKET